MSHSFVCNLLHIVFSTKSRRPFLSEDALRDEMHAYLGGVCRNLKSPVLTIGGTEDHVHLLVSLHQSLSLDDLLRDIKRSSSKLVKTKGEKYAEFHWQNGYAAFSISPSHVDALKEYIANQREHHRKVSFEDELQKLMEKYGVDSDRLG